MDSLEITLAFILLGAILLSFGYIVLSFSYRSKSRDRIEYILGFSLIAVGAFVECATLFNYSYFKVGI